jgi:hypothetical protein
MPMATTATVERTPEIAAMLLAPEVELLLALVSLVVPVPVEIVSQIHSCKVNR